MTLLVVHMCSRQRLKIYRTSNLSMNVHQNASCRNAMTKSDRNTDFHVVIRVFCQTHTQ